MVSDSMVVIGLIVLRPGHVRAVSVVTVRVIQSLNASQELEGEL